MSARIPTMDRLPDRVDRRSALRTTAGIAGTVALPAVAGCLGDDRDGGDPGGGDGSAGDDAPPDDGADVAYAVETAILPVGNGIAVSTKVA